MATALDFPNNPTVGQQWLGTNGALYVWDGFVWDIKVITPGGTAGGDLTGNYPNPQIAPLAIVDGDVHDVSWAKITNVPPNLSPWTDTGTALQPKAGVNYPISVGPITLPYGADILWGPGNQSIQTDTNGNLILAGGGTVGGITLTPAAGYEITANANIRIMPNDQLIFDHFDANPPTAVTLGTVRFTSSNRTGAQIVAKTDAAWSAGSIPTRMTFSVGVASVLVDALLIDGNAYTYINNRARIGDFTQGPRDTLDLKGGVIVSVSQAVTPVAGIIQYATGHFQGYNGTAWVNLDVQGSGQPAGTAGGDLAGSTYPNPVIAPLAVTNAKINDVAWSKVTGAPTSFPPTGAAGGDLAGSSYPNPVIAGGAVTDAKIANVSWGKVTGAPTSYPPTGGASNDLSGSYPGPTVWRAGGDFHVGQDCYIARNTNANGGVGTFAGVSTINIRYWNGSAYGNAFAFWWVGNQTQLYVDGTYNGIIQMASCDERWKTDIQEDVPGLDVVRALHPITYRSNRPLDKDSRYYGLIAQEAQPHVPLAVSETTIGEEKEGPYLVLDYQVLIPVLIKAIQELAARI